MQVMCTLMLRSVESGKDKLKKTMLLPKPNQSKSTTSAWKILLSVVYGRATQFARLLPTEKYRK